LDDLCGDRDGNFLGCMRIDGDSDGRMDTSEFLRGNSFLLHQGEDLANLGGTAHHAEVAEIEGQEVGQDSGVVGVAPGHDDDP